MLQFIKEAELRMKISIKSVIDSINTIYKKTVEKGITNIVQLQTFISLPRIKDYFFEQVKSIINL